MIQDQRFGNNIKPVTPTPTPDTYPVSLFQIAASLKTLFPSFNVLCIRKCDRHFISPHNASTTALKSESGLSQYHIKVRLKLFTCQVFDVSFLSIFFNQPTNSLLPAGERGSFLVYKTQDMSQ